MKQGLDFCIRFLMIMGIIFPIRNLYAQNSDLIDSAKIFQQIGDSLMEADNSVENCSNSELSETDSGGN